ncbi:MAG: hypothetical protein ABJF11_02685 [Reichenbachiella sp.]|uniref:hypothetical protein n=1 Tax=Reichenbachiella sp. TaxID=2184521 RepID=UPI00326774EA
MIVWSGRGYTIPLVFILSAFVGVVLIEDVNLLALTVSATVGIFSWVKGRKWNNVAPRLYRDEATGEQVVVKPNHSLFWIKMQYWGIFFGLSSIRWIVAIFMDLMEPNSL